MAIPYFLRVAYVGIGFYGWQIQTSLRSVQNELWRAVQAFEPGAPMPAGTGRTDAGVHARGQGVLVLQGDMQSMAEIQRIIDETTKAFGYIDCWVNNAGVTILDRHWDKLTPDSIDYMVKGNLNAALYCVTVALPFMRAQQDGLIIHTASMAGRFIGGVSGPIYVAAKHGVVAMSHGLNMQECINGIRSTVFLPGEVATPILDQRPNPVSAEMRARMVQPADCGDLIRYIACMPKHLVMNEVHLAPTWNRGYVAALERKL